MTAPLLERARRSAGSASVWRDCGAYDVIVTMATFSNWGPGQEAWLGMGHYWCVSAHCVMFHTFFPSRTRNLQLTSAQSSLQAAVARQLTSRLLWSVAIVCLHESMGHLLCSFTLMLTIIHILAHTPTQTHKDILKLYIYMYSIHVYVILYTCTLTCTLTHIQCSFSWYTEPERIFSIFDLHSFLPHNP